MNHKGVNGKPQISDALAKQIQEYHDQGNSLRKCAKKFGFHRTSISKKIIVNKSKMSDDEVRLAMSRKVVNWRQKAKEKLVSSMGGKCSKCGYSKCIHALHFHHTDPSQKDFTISGKSWSYDRLSREVGKCVLLCSNCHAEEHYKVFHSRVSQLVESRTVNSDYAGSSPAP